MAKQTLLNRPPKIGDRIKFKSVTRSSNSAAVRKVKLIRPDGSVEVGFHGWSNFVVFPHEIIGVMAEN